MSGSEERILRLLQGARRELELERKRRAEPIAVVGVGCRFPGGASGPDGFWHVLAQGIDATGDVPPDRWDAQALFHPDPGAPGKCYVKRGAFLEGIDAFEPAFFGISPREAAGLDPQQRLLLEVVWEALEDAGVPPDRLQGTATGVWIGLSLDDYARRSVASGNLAAIDPYNALGSARSVAAGRIAYVLGLHGPVIQIDTSCSSSLVAVHLACQSLRAAECDLALVGGVNLMSSPEASVALCRLGALARDGRCKTFDASADGYGRGEGCGIAVLKRLTEAQAAGDRIYAVVRGSAINHDGKSNGLTAPNGFAQEAVIRRALANAGLAASAVSYVEAHGTGTALGDPIEVFALGRVYADQRPPEAPLYLGSVKTNIGHLEGAAGIASFLKVALCLAQGDLVPHLHLREPNPRIRWQDLPIRVVTERTRWESNGVPRVAGVSSFGISGTNAHVLLEQAPARARCSAAPLRSAELLVVSAKTAPALQAAVSRLAHHLQSRPEIALGDLAFSLATTRSLMQHRLALVVRSREELSRSLSATAPGPLGASRGTAREMAGKLAWLFSGQGAQRAGMGRELWDEWPVFRAALESAWGELDQHLPRPLRDIQWAEPGTAEGELLHQTAHTQPALFALQWALAALWESWGIRPSLVAGHSVGEIGAACVAGVLTLSDAARLVCERGRLIQSLPSGGAMVAIQAPVPEVDEAVRAYQKTVSVAAINGPRAVVIAGVEAHVLAIADSFTRTGYQAKRLNVSHAFHSALLEPILEDFGRVAHSINYRPPSIAMVSNLSGRADAEVATPAYWVKHLRHAVRFSEGVSALHRAGAKTFIELGPSAVLLPMVRACLPDDESRLLASLRPGRSETQTMLEGLAAWVVSGGSVEWKAVFPEGGHSVPLPTYPWQRERYWIASGPGHEDRRPASEEPDASRPPPPASGLVSGVVTLHTDPCGAGTSPAGVVTGAPADKLYTVAWRPMAPEEPGPAHGDGFWVVLGPQAEAQTLAAALIRSGATAATVDHLGSLGRYLTGGSPLRGVLHLVPPGSQGEREMLAVQRLLAHDEPSGPRVFWVIQGAMGTGAGDPPTRPEAAVSWALGRTFALEHPQRWGGLIDRSGEVLDERTADRLVGLVSNTKGEDQLALREKIVLVPRLVRSEPPRSAPFRLPTEGMALVTGGLGGVGRHIARWLAERGAKHLLLSSRRGLRTPGAKERVSELTALGAKVTVIEANVVDREAMGRALHDMASERLTTVFHAAGVHDTTMLADLSLERLNQVLAAKRQGIWVLDELTREHPIELWVCISSIAGVWGAHGQGAYAAGNAFLDAWAQAARASGRNVVSVAFGPWASEGMADEKSRAELGKRGLHAMDPRSALLALEQALASGEPHAVVADVDWDVFRAGFRVWASRPLLGELLPNSPDRVTTDSPPDDRQTLSELPPGEREGALRALLGSEIKRILRLPNQSEIRLDRPLAELGFDSLMFVELRSALSRRTDAALPATLDSSQATPEAILGYLLSGVPEPAQQREDPREGRPSLSGSSSETSRVAEPADPAFDVARCERLQALGLPTSRLFCFHDAGGSPAMFVPFGGLAIAGVEVHAVSHSRNRPPSSASAEEYLRQVVGYVRGLADRPYAFFGHSLGSLFAWRVAGELVLEGAPWPMALFPSGSFSPGGLGGQLAVDDLEQMAHLVLGRGEAATENLRRDFVHDMLLWRAMPARRLEPLELPISAFMGNDDHVVSEREMASWAEYTTDEFSLTVMPGGHAYPTQQLPRELLLLELGRRLSSLLPGKCLESARSAQVRSTTRFW